MSEPSIVEFDRARNVFRQALAEITRLYGPGSEETAALGMLTFATREYTDVAGKEQACEILRRLLKTVEEESH